MVQSLQLGASNQADDQKGMRRLNRLPIPELLQIGDSVRTVDSRQSQGNARLDHRRLSNEPLGFQGGDSRSSLGRARRGFVDPVTRAVPINSRRGNLHPDPCLVASSRKRRKHVPESIDLNLLDRRPHRPIEADRPQDGIDVGVPGKVAVLPNIGDVRDEPLLGPPPRFVRRPRDDMSRITLAEPSLGDSEPQVAGSEYPAIASRSVDGWFVHRFKLIDARAKGGGSW